MPKIIVTTRYVKPTAHKKFGNYIKYIASAHLICYLREQHGGTFYTVNYAMKKGLNIIRL